MHSCFDASSASSSLLRSAASTPATSDTIFASVRSEMACTSPSALMKSVTVAPSAMAPVNAESWPKSSPRHYRSLAAVISLPRWSGDSNRPALLKQFTTVVFFTLFHARVIIWIVLSRLIFSSTSKRRLIRSRCTRCRLYPILSALIMPWSKGCNLAMVLSVKNLIVILFKWLTTWCGEQLSTRRQMLRSAFSNLASTSADWLREKVPCHTHAFLLKAYRTGRLFGFLKQRSNLLLPIKNGRSLQEPSKFTASRIETHTLLILPPWQEDPFKSNVLFVNIGQNSAVLSALKISNGEKLSWIFGHFWTATFLYPGCLSLYFRRTRFF